MHYDRYDTKFKDSHDSLTWEAEEETVQKFKHEYIYPNIVKGEIEGNSMGTWLEKLSSHSYEPPEEVLGEKETENGEKEAGDDDDDDDNANDEDNEKDKCSEVKTDTEKNVDSCVS